MYTVRNKRIGLFLACFLCLLFVFSFAGCGGEDFEDGPNEYGFVEWIDLVGNGGVDYRCAYRLNETEFCKDNVTVEVFYGHFSFATLPVYPDDPEDTMGRTVTFRLYFDKEDNISYRWNVENAYLIKELRYYEFYSDIYTFYSEKGKTKYRYTFTHSEVLQIPPALFTESQGRIVFELCTYSKRVDRFESPRILSIDYRLDGDRVTLSVPKH